jgi:hypothetical protein
VVVAIQQTQLDCRGCEFVNAEGSECTRRMHTSNAEGEKQQNSEESFSLPKALPGSLISSIDAFTCKIVYMICQLKNHKIEGFCQMSGFDFVKILIWVERSVEHCELEWAFFGLALRGRWHRR